MSAEFAISVKQRRGSMTVHDEARAVLEAHGLHSAGDVLALDGVVVSGHVRRNVSRVALGSTTVYLKREHRVGWKDRWRNFRDGFGMISLSEREAVILKALDAQGIAAPRWLAYGESGGQAFLMLEACEHQPMRTFPIAAVAESIKRLHRSKIYQPDVFAKHLLVHPATGDLLMLDWQRATLQRAWSLQQRVQSLAMLLATTPDTLLDDSGRHEFLAHFPDLDRSQILDLVQTYRSRPSVRKQLAPNLADVDQQLVRIDGETVCAIPEIAGHLRSPCAIDHLYRRRSTDEEYVPTGTSIRGTLRSSRYGLTRSRLVALLRGKAWRSAELRQARLLFHLERHGIPAPRMLAYGQRESWLLAESFLLFANEWKPIDGDRIDIVDRLHTSGVRIDDPAKAFALRDHTLGIVDPAGLSLSKSITPAQRDHDLAKLQAFCQGKR